MTGAIKFIGMWTLVSIALSLVIGPLLKRRLG